MKSKIFFLAILAFTCTCLNAQLGAPRPCKVTIYSENPTMGTVTIEGPENPVYGDTLVIKAIPTECNKFSNWSDCTTTKSTRTITVKRDTTIVAVFKSSHRWAPPTYIWSVDSTHCTAMRICNADNTHKEIEVSNVVIDTILPTCYNNGSITYTANFTNPVFKTRTLKKTLPAFGHDWEVSHFTWGTDSTGCTLNCICKTNPLHTKSEYVPSKIDTIPSTCSSKGKIIFTAEFTHYDTIVSVEKTLPELSEHNWSDPIYVWVSDFSECTATRICKTNINHIETETVTPKKDTILATCDSTGSVTFTANFVNKNFSTQIISITKPTLKSSRYSFADSAVGSYELNGEIYTETGIYTQTIPNAVGCDSIITLDLTILPPCQTTYGTDTQVACGSYTWIDGEVYTESNNTATYTLINENGCDSIVTLNLTIRPYNITKLWDDVVSVINPTHEYKSFKWYHNNQYVGDNSYYSELGGLSGTYYLIATTNTGEEIRSCDMEFIPQSHPSIKVYPNPTSDIVFIENVTATDFANLIVLDINGNVIPNVNATYTESNRTIELNLSAQTSGTYIINFGPITAKVVKK